MKNRFLLVPFIIFFYFFYHNVSDHFYFLKATSVLTTFLKYFIIIGLIYLAGFKIFKNKEKYTLGFSTILFFFLFFGAFVDTAVKYKLFQAESGIYLKLVIIFLIIIIAIVFITRLISKAFTRKLLLFWMVYCTFLIIYATGTFVLSTKKEKKYLATPADFKLNDTTLRPDIFYMVFDMYPSDTVFQKYLNHDNSFLSSYLKQNGFYVSGNAQSLYNQTYYSLSSTLNLETLNFYSDSSIEKYKKILLGIKRAERSQLLSSFQNSGYTIHNFSVFNLQDQPSPLSFNLNYHIDNLLTATTFFNRIFNEVEPDFLFAGKNIDISFLKDTWSDNIRKDIKILDSNFYILINSTYNKPAFNYFHFMIPHPPMLFDSAGNENTVKDMYFLNGYDKGLEKYISYTKYGNKKIIGMVNKIFEKAGENVIIIIQGDHGFREFQERFPDKVRSGILNAVYLPSKNYSNFNDTMNPVFTFKQILKNQFNTFIK